MTRKARIRSPFSINGIPRKPGDAETAVRPLRAEGAASSAGGEESSPTRSKDHAEAAPAAPGEADGD